MENHETRTEADTVGEKKKKKKILTGQFCSENVKMFVTLY